MMKRASYLFWALSVALCFGVGIYAVVTSAILVWLGGGIIGLAILAVGLGLLNYAQSLKYNKQMQGVLNKATAKLESSEKTSVKPIVVKIGGSTFDSGDTVIEDLVVLQREGRSLVVVHGGANEVTEWLSRQGIATKIVDGLRITDHQTLQVVVAVLCGAVNKGLVADIQSRGGRAMGLSGIDGRLIEAKVKDEELGYMGEVVKINPEPIEILLKEGYIPVVAPSGFGVEEAMPLNVNADPAAGALAAALEAERLILLTDVAGVMDDAGKLLPCLSPGEARSLIASGVVAGGMIPKVEACLCALATVPVTQIVDGRVPHALVEAVVGKGSGTIIA